MDTGERKSEAVNHQDATVLPPHFNCQDGFAACQITHKTTDWCVFKKIDHNGAIQI